MFEIVLQELAVDSLKRLKPFHRRAILDAIEAQLRSEPQRPSKSSIKRLRGHQRSTYRLRVGAYRVFYDVAHGTVTILNILHKSQTAAYYGEGETE